MLSRSEVGAGWPAPLPNGCQDLQFFRLFSQGETLPDGNRAEFFPGSVKIHDRDQILLHVVDSLDCRWRHHGASTSRPWIPPGVEPTVTGFYKVVRAGDTLPDGKTVRGVHLADLNQNGSVAACLQMAGEPSPSLYLEKERSGGTSPVGLQRVLGYQTPTPDGEGFFGAALGNFDLHENDNLLVAAHWYARQGARTGEALFSLPGGVVDHRGAILAQAGDQIPGGSQIINQLGLVHGHYADGDYVVQAHTDIPQGTGRSSTGAPEAGSVVILGNARNWEAGHTLIAASPGLALSTAARLATSDTTGDVMYGPRIGDDGNVATVTHLTDAIMRLTHGSHIIITSGDATPTGMTVTGMGGPVVGRGGLVYFVVSGADGKQELTVSNGERERDPTGERGEAFRRRRPGARLHRVRLRPGAGRRRRTFGLHR